jgi:hypothetical protein
MTTTAVELDHAVFFFFHAHKGANKIRTIIATVFVDFLLPSSDNIECFAVGDIVLDQRFTRCAKILTKFDSSLDLKKKQGK